MVFKGYLMLIVPKTVSEVNVLLRTTTMVVFIEKNC